MVKAIDSEDLETPTVETNGDQPKRVFVPQTEARAHAYWFMAVFAVIVMLLLLFFASLNVQLTADENGNDVRTACDLSEWKIFVFAGLAAAAGSAIHAITSFVTFAGNRELVQSWIFWLYMRVPVGVLLGLLVYLGLRAGQFAGLKGGANFDLTSLFFVGFMCGISGLFSKQVTDKLGDMVDTLFAPRQPPVRKDKLAADGNEASLPASTGPAPRQGKTLSPPDATVLAVQGLLMALGYLPAQAPGGEAPDDGVLGDQTRGAIESYLADVGITGEVRAQTLGEESDPDFWVNLLGLLQDDAESKRLAKASGAGENADDGPEDGQGQQRPDD